MHRDTIEVHLCHIPMFPYVLCQVCPWVTGKGNEFAPLLSNMLSSPLVLLYTLWHGAKVSLGVLGVKTKWDEVGDPLTVCSDWEKSPSVEFSCAYCGVGVLESRPYRTVQKRTYSSEA